MKKYSVSYSVELGNFSVGADIEANSPEEAQAIFDKQLEDCETLHDLLLVFGGCPSCIDVYDGGDNGSGEIEEIE